MPSSFGSKNQRSSENGAATAIACIGATAPCGGPQPRTAEIRDTSGGSAPGAVWQTTATQILQRQAGDLRRIHEHREADRLLARQRQVLEVLVFEEDEDFENS